MTSLASAATGTAPVRAKIGIAGLLTAEAISIIGTRMSFLAIPWLVLVTTHDPIKVGIVAGAETLPYVFSSALAAPLQDRLGYRRAAIIADISSALAMAAFAVGQRFHFGLLVALVAVAGMVRALGDRSKNNLLKPLMETAKLNFARVTSAYEGIMRTSGLIGASLGGVAIAALGPVGAVWFDAATFAVCAVLVVTVVPDPARVGAVEATGTTTTPPAREPYFTALRGGFAYFKQDRLIRNVTGMLFATNLFNQASAVVFVPLWVLTVLHSPVALGFVSAAFAVGAIVGNIVFGTLAPYLPRYSTLLFGYFVGGLPRLLILALSDNLAVVVAVTFVSGMAMCSINPTIGAMIFQRIPSEMLARVGGNMAAVSFGGIPLGGLFAGWAVTTLGLHQGILLASVLYFAVTLTPVVRHRTWRELNDATRKRPSIGDEADLPRTYAMARTATGLRVTLSYVDGEWSVRASQGLRTLARRRPVRPSVARQVLSQLDIPAVHDAVHDYVYRDRALIAHDTQQLRERVAAWELISADITAALDTTRGSGSRALGS